MLIAEAKKAFLKLFIGFLSLTALIAIFSVLSGDFGEFQLKVLATTFTISAASICSMSCAAFIEKRKKVEIGMMGIISNAVAALLVVCGVWFEVSSEGYWKSAITCIVVGVSLSHAFLLTLPDLDTGHGWTQKASSFIIGVLALQIIAAVWGEIDDAGYYKLMAVVSIVVVLFTLIIPILMKMSKGLTEVVETLVLTRSEDGSYVDRDGARYQVSLIDEQADF